MLLTNLKKKQGNSLMFNIQKMENRHFINFFIIRENGNIIFENFLFKIAQITNMKIKN
jgi:hypothetical protein